MAASIRKLQLAHWRNAVVAGIVVIVIAWGLFRPDFRPDGQLIGNSVREELIKAGFKATQGITSASFEAVESSDGFNGKWITRQRISAHDDLVTEKWTDRATNGQRQETVGLYVGPFAVLRYSRQWLPIVGNLLPNHLWQSSIMTGFSIERVENFPHQTGGSLAAKVSYEERFATGEVAKTESTRLQCSVGKIDRAATTIDPRLPGLAARIDCTETTEESISQERNSGAGLPSPAKLSYSHWYVFDRGWSIPFESKRESQFGNIGSQVKWTSSLTAFE